jgi:protein TonB
VTAAAVLEPFEELIEVARAESVRNRATKRHAPHVAHSVEPELHLERFATLEGGADVRRRRGLSISASVVIHAVAAVAVVVVPLLITEALPVGEQAIRAFFVEPIQVPAPPPPPPPAPPRAAPAPPGVARPVAEAAAFTAPIEVPTQIVPEGDLQIGVEGGVAGGVEGGVPGGVVGGVVAGLPEAPVPARPKPVRVGGDVRDPRKVVDAPAVYPELALAARVEGIVIIEATVDTRGRVSDAKVLRGVPMLDEAALEAVRQWVYTPTLLNGVPTPIIMTVTVNFRLKTTKR